VRSAATRVDPDPKNKSRTTSPGRLEFSIARSIKGSGFMVGWSGESEGRSIFQMSDWSRPPEK
jgi:hypothetical protein